jgi:hypothetical protein
MYRNAPVLQPAGYSSGLFWFTILAIICSPLAFLLYVAGRVLVFLISLRLDIKEEKEYERLDAERLKNKRD